MIAAEATNDMTISRVGELKERQKSLRENMPLNRTSSNLSMTSSLNSDRSDPATEEERLARSLSRIRIRRPSQSANFNVDLTGINNAEAPKSETDTVSSSGINKPNSSSQGQPTGGIISKVYGKTILANYPVKESAMSKAYKNTILANYPSPSEEGDVTERTLSFSDDGSSNQSRASK